MCLLLCATGDAWWYLLLLLGSKKQNYVENLLMEVIYYEWERIIAIKNDHVIIVFHCIYL